MALYEVIPDVAGGFILRPGATPLTCGSRDSCDDRSWCETPVVAEYLTRCVDWSQCETPYGGDMGCQWKPTDTGKWIEIQTAWQRSQVGYERNEIIVSSAAWNAALPGLVDAVFITRGPLAGGDGSMARRVHSGFLQAYPSLSEVDVPLVVFDPANWEVPFSLPGPD